MSCMLFTMARQTNGSARLYRNNIEMRISCELSQPLRTSHFIGRRSGSMLLQRLRYYLYNHSKLVCLLFNGLQATCMMVRIIHKDWAKAVLYFGPTPDPLHQCSVNISKLYRTGLRGYHLRIRRVQCLQLAKIVSLEHSRMLSNLHVATQTDILLI